MSSPNLDRIQEFLNTPKLEAAQGGQKTGWWRKRLATIFLGVGFLLGSAFALNRPMGADDVFSKEKYKKYITDAQASVNAIKDNRPIAIIDRTPVKNDILIIIGSMVEALNQKGKPLKNISVALRVKEEMPGMTGMAWRIRNDSTQALPDLGIVLPMHPSTTARAKMRSYANLPLGFFFRKDLPVSTFHTAMFTYWHEAFGHCTEGADLLGVPYNQHIRHLMEVRSDIAASICMARMDGHTCTARSIAMIRDIGIYFNFKHFKNTSWIRESPASACIYNLGPTSRMACDEIDRILADPVKAKAFRNMDPTATVALTNEIFDKVKPSKALSLLRASIIRDAILQETDETIKARVDANEDLKLQTALYLKQVNQSKACMLSPLRKEFPLPPVLSPPMPVPAKPGA
ncbi:MAG TPA: hypothetical protein DCW68_02210 [Rhodospirillaceae bacterium]|nr:MAG: hypothetical protein A2018_05175 [Alphaproteobacteria bacterium GWF2_58_20]HAU28909.1 hypothetical protein [Rhodospirillaceae bacterium]